MTETERELLRSLNQLLASPAIASEIDNIANKLELRFQNSNEPLAWETIPLEIYGNSLPPEVRSSWVFVLREGCASGAERHPNSHQRVRSWRGKGDFQIQQNDAWESHFLKPGFDSAVEKQWASIPENVWHQAVVEPGNHWFVVSFHTVDAGELIEERQDTEDADQFKQRNYIA